MSNSKGIIVFKNTIVMYVNIIVKTLIWLYLMRVVLNVLGVEDFGIYNLIAGVIALLTFVNSALMSSTQRYLSFAIGAKDDEGLRKYFQSGLVIHFGIAVLLTLIFEIIGLFIFDGFLNIPAERIDVAKEVYQLMIFSTVASIISVPYNAAINAHEDIWYLGIIHIISTVIKLFVIFGFRYIHFDSLLLYTIWISSAQVFELLAALVWSVFKYKECRFVSDVLSYHKKYIKEMLGFSGWNTLGAFAVVCRNQGISVTLNVFFGPTINAVFGIANQIDGQLVGFANTLTAAMSPQIVKSEGEGNKRRLLFLSVFSSKLSFMLSVVFALPLFIEFPLILRLWLKDVPDFSEIYCSVILMMFLVCELYPGLSRGIQAVGDIKWVMILSSICVVLPIPVGCLIFKFGVIHYYITALMLIMQIVSLAIHVYYSNRFFNLSISSFTVFIIKSTLIVVVLFLGGHSIKYFVEGQINEILRLLIVTVTVVPLFLITYYYYCFDSEEKTKIKVLVQNLVNKLKNK